MKARLIRIGNSRGVRLPKALIEQVGLGDEVVLHVEDRRLIITAATPPRAGWSEAARQLGSEADVALDPPTPTRFDEAEWEW